MCRIDGVLTDSFGHREAAIVLDVATGAASGSPWSFERIAGRARIGGLMSFSSTVLRAYRRSVGLRFAGD
jgi:hypothetical protein